MSVLYIIKGKKLLYLLLDIVIVELAYIISFVLRFSPDLSSSLQFLHIKYFLIVTVSYFISLYFFQIYRVIWMYSNIKDVYRLTFSNMAGCIICVVYLKLNNIVFSRLTLLTTFFLVLIGTVFYRILIRDYFIRLKSTRNNQKGKNILIIGAGEAGRGVLSEYGKQGRHAQIVGFLDDDETKVNKILNGKKIISTTEKVEDVVNSYKISEIIIAIPSANSKQIKDIYSRITRIDNFSNVKVKILPPINEILSQHSLLQVLREVTITDLMGREEFFVDLQSMMSLYKGKTVMVTGAGGSIGSEICNQLLKFDIKSLVAIGRGENSIYQLINSLQKSFPADKKPVELKYFIANIKDRELIDIIFRKTKPDIVFHAAAHKHVPLMETNEVEAIQNNIFGTLNLLKISRDHRVKKFVLISTDKAVNPSNIMGATKRIAEILTGYFYHFLSLNTSTVRFGNVLGSRGSVIPLFQEQIKKGGPVTVTHPEIKRYFMSIPEASILVINAAAYSEGGELFLLDMGKPHKILDIAKNLIRIYGYEPEKEIAIEFTGLRPGEKLFEELFNNKENMIKTKNKKIYVLSTNFNYKKEAVDKFLNDLENNLIKYDEGKIRKKIKEIVPEFNYKNYINKGHA